MNFDCFDSKYFLVYRGKNIIDVYTLDLQVYLKYRMRLPLYKDFEHFEFKLSLDHSNTVPNPIRTYRDHFFSFLMVDSRNTTSTMLFVHILRLNQHNAFVMSRDFSRLLGFNSSW